MSWYSLHILSYDLLLFLASCSSSTGRASLSITYQKLWSSSCFIPCFNCTCMQFLLCNFTAWTTALCSHAAAIGCFVWNNCWTFSGYCLCTLSPRLYKLHIAVSSLSNQGLSSFSFMIKNPLQLVTGPAVAHELQKHAVAQNISF